MGDWLNLKEVEPLRLRDLAKLVDQDLILQVSIAVLSLLAIAMISSTGPLHRWGFVIGLISQPLWLIATWRARQWGMFVLSIFYLVVWIQGIANRFF
jgi:hypothetical protein